MRIDSSKPESLLEYRTPSGYRIINSITSLAEGVHGLAGAGYRDPTTMRPVLSEILRGIRPATAEVKSAILETARKSSVSIPEVELEGALNYFREFMDRCEGKSDRREFACEKPSASALFRLVRDSSEIVAVLPTGIFSDYAGRLILEMFAQRVGLIAPRTETEKQKLQVTLWFKDEISVKRWWFLLQEFLDEVDSSTSTNTHMQALANACSNNSIQTYVVNPVVAAAKVIISEPDNLEKTRGFNFNLSRGLRVAFLSSLGPDATREWIEDVYNRTKSSPGETRRIQAETVFVISE